MAPQGVERRLAAILAADVVGYSRLMEADEEGTARTLAAYRQVIDSLVADHRGRVFGGAGDSVIAEFASPVAAVRCAIDIQDAAEQRNGDLPEDRRMRFRIGINLGDVMVEEQNLLGDGVNVAARLESIAEPGGICISEKVREEVYGKLATAFVDAGEQSLKNMVKPIRVWRWSRASPTTGSLPGEQSDFPAPPDKPSIAVLPFANMSGDVEQEYLADGITEDLITALSKVRWFFVIARNSTFTYKGQAIDVTTVAQQLGVRYVLEGSVRVAGKRVRITVQLIDATTGRHVWAERYDREIEDIFELQDEMTLTIVGAVEPELGAAERERVLRKPPENLDAWQTYQRSLWHLWRFTKDDNAEARHLLQRARELDPKFATAHAYESYAHYMNVAMGYAEAPAESLAAAMVAAKKALALDDKDPVGYFALGRVHMMRGEHDASVAAIETALALNPSFAQAYHGLGFALVLSGRLEEAIDAQGKAARLSPRDPLLWVVTVIHALACILMSRFQEAADMTRKTMLIPRATGYWPHAVLASALANLGQIDEARTAVHAALEQKPDLSLAYLEKTLPTKEPGGLEPYLDGLRKAGLPE